MRNHFAKRCNGSVLNTCPRIAVASQVPLSFSCPSTYLWRALATSVWYGIPSCKARTCDALRSFDDNLILIPASFLNVASA